MNVARSIFMRKGYLFTALAVAVLLAGSAGTAWAQTGTKVTATSRFTGSSGTLPEGADALASTPAPLEVTIRRTTKTRNDPYNYPPSAANDDHLEIQFEYDGDPGLPLGVTVRADYATQDLTINATEGTASLNFPASGTMRLEKTTVPAVEEETTRMVFDRPDVDIAETEIVLTFVDGRMDDGDWLPEKFSMTLTKGAGLGVASEYTESQTSTQTGLRDALWDPFVNDFTSSKFTVTIADDDPQPVFKFTGVSSALAKTDIQLAEGSEQTVVVRAGIGAGGEGSLPGEVNDGNSIKDTLGDLSGAGDDILLSVSPADALGPADEDDDRGIISIQFNGADIFHLADAQGRYDIGEIADAVTTNGVGGIPLKIKAKDVTGFRDERVTLMLMDGRTEEQKNADGGAVGDAAPATVTVRSGKETPTVTFSTDSIDIDEGDSETVHLLAGGMQGDEVGAVTVVVRGDADISLEQNGSPIGGTVSFGGNANAELTIVANSDPSLEDGEEKTATVSITNASGALIGDPNTVTVTVVGSTAVPVLPLVGQLLLALLLMVGGARLYRRRQG